MDNLAKKRLEKQGVGIHRIKALEYLEKENYFEFLDNLRESGVTNMFGAVPYLTNVFPKLSDNEAAKVLKEWMATFSERHKEK